jgi:hypothetical protein
MFAFCSKNPIRKHFSCFELYVREMTSEPDWVVLTCAQFTLNPQKIASLATGIDIQFYVTKQKPRRVLNAKIA